MEKPRSKHAIYMEGWRARNPEKQSAYGKIHRKKKRATKRAAMCDNILNQKNNLKGLARKNDILRMHNAGKDEVTIAIRLNIPISTIQKVIAQGV